MSMRLPTVSQYKTQLTQMSKQYDGVSKLQVQVATGKKIQQSSDDPLLASRIKSVEDYLDRLKSYETNTALAENRLSLSSLTLQNSVDLTTKAQELLLRAQNGTMNNVDRANIASELSGILGHMVTIANTQDGNGESIFNGFEANTPAYIQNNGVFQYQGSYNGNYIPISDQNQVQYSDSGFAVFGDIKSGTGIFSVESDAVGNTGSGVLQPITVSNAGGVIVDSYTLSIVTNSEGKLAYTVTGATSGQVLPDPPLLMPDNAPEYVAGSTISFNGLSTQLNGIPADGDTFTISPSASQNIFNTLQNVIDALNTAVTSPKGQADLNQVLLEESSTLSGTFNHLVGQAANVGQRAKLVNDQIKFNKDTNIEQQFVLGSLSDADMTQAISDLTQQLTALDICQQSYLKIQEVFSRLMRENFR